MTETEIETAPETAAPAQEDEAAAADDAPKCVQCQQPLTWRDSMYTPADSTLCKTCHQHAKRVQARGHYLPLFDTTGKHVGMAIFWGQNRAARRDGAREARLKQKREKRKLQQMMQLRILRTRRAA